MNRVSDSRVSSTTKRAEMVILCRRIFCLEKRMEFRFSSHRSLLNKRFSNTFFIEIEPEEKALNERHP